METYAFWRPPVRTLTFEDFTNMQKQQGVCHMVTWLRCSLYSRPRQLLINDVLKDIKI